MVQLCEVEAEESVEGGVGTGSEVATGQHRHVSIVGAFAVGVKSAAAVESAEVALEGGTDVVQFVEEGDELIVETLIEETGQAEGDEIEHLPAIDEVALDLIIDAFASAGELSAAEA